jgi:polar amino acid transport system substrate-binding protein
VHRIGRRTLQRRRAALLATLLAAAWVPWPARAAEPLPALQLLTEEYPPLSFTRDGELRGIAVELVAEIQHRVGSSVPVQVMPWARAYPMALHQPNVGLFSTARTPEREKLFQWVGPLFVGKTSLYALRGSGLRLHSLADAASAGPILVPREDYKEKLLRAAGLQNLLLANNHEQMVRMLLTGRAPLMAASNLTLPALLSQTGSDLQALELVHTFHQSEAYVAFSLGTPEETVRGWQAALDAMKRDGFFGRVVARWLPGDVP